MELRFQRGSPAMTACRAHQMLLRVNIQYHGCLQQATVVNYFIILLDMIADRQTDKHTHTDTLITILRSPIGGGVIKVVDHTRKNPRVPIAHRA